VVHEYGPDHQVRPRKHLLDGERTEGIEPEKPPYRPGGRTEGPMICFVRDPDGYRVELVERSG